MTSQFNLKTFLFFVLSLNCISSFGSETEVEVYGRTYVNSCGYFSNEAGDYSINFKHRALPWGTRVFVVSGWKGYNMKFGGSSAIEQWFDWGYRSEQEAKAVGPFHWRVETHQVLHERTSSVQLKFLQFSIRVEVPGKAPAYFPQMAWSYYEGEVRGQYANPCVSGGVFPPYKLISHKVVETN